MSKVSKYYIFLVSFKYILLNITSERNTLSICVQFWSVSWQVKNGIFGYLHRQNYVIDFLQKWCIVNETLLMAFNLKKILSTTCFILIEPKFLCSGKPWKFWQELYNMYMNEFHLFCTFQKVSQPILIICTLLCLTYVCEHRNQASYD